MTARNLAAAAPDYQEHLRSDYWQAVRNIALRISGGACSCCGAKERLEVHHKNGDGVRGHNGYANLGRETLEDVAVLCRDCHARHHGGAAVREIEVVKEVLVLDGPDVMTDEDRAVADRIAGEVFGE